MAEPLLRLLHAQGQRLTVAALPWVAPVFQAMPQVVESTLVLPFARGGLQLKSRFAFARLLKSQAFNAAYVLPNSWKSGLLPFLARIPKRIGYTGEARLGLLTQRLPNPAKSAKPPMVAFYAALALANLSEALLHPRLEMSAEQIQQVLAIFGLQPGAYTVFAPGAEYGPAKRWPQRHFSALSSVLGQPVVLLGSTKEAADCQAIATAAPDPTQCLNLAGKTSLPQAMALIAGSAGVVSNDSGLMHVAAALSVPQVAVFGSSSPLHTPPLNAKASVVWLKNDAAYQPPLTCAPCFARVCPLGHLRCLNDVLPAQVAHALWSQQPKTSLHKL